MAAGIVVGLLVLHPVTMAIYWLEAHPEVPAVSSAWEFALYRVIRAFTPAMLPMTATFAVLGAALGVGSGLYAIALRRHERQLARLAAELGADVRELIRVGEGPRLELKSAARWDYRKGAGSREIEAAIARSIAGFMNAEGGTLLLGIADDGEVLGLEKDFHTLRSKDKDGYQRFLVDLVAMRLGTDACPLVHVLFHELEGRDVCRVMVESSQRPVFFADADRSRLFLRTGSATRELDAAEAVRHVTGR
ncbi:MAG TPA: ATP-binding protein [Candidatus Binatia bacterium]|nr:ATP-binding protein [Candidatus Binatia bacterium]